MIIPPNNNAFTKKRCKKHTRREKSETIDLKACRRTATTALIQGILILWCQLVII